MFELPKFWYYLNETVRINRTIQQRFVNNNFEIKIHQTKI